MALVGETRPITDGATDRDGFGFGRIIGSSLSRVVRNFRALLALGILLDCAGPVLETLGLARLQLSDFHLGFPLTGAGWLVSVVCGTLLQAAVTNGMMHQAGGHAPSIRRDLRAAVRDLPSLLKIAAITAPVYAAFTIAVLGPIYAAKLLGQGAAVIAGVLMLCVGFGGGPLIIWFWSSTVAAIPVSAVERLSALTCLRRSFALSRGYRWRIIGVLIAVGLITGVGQLVVRLLVSAVFMATHLPRVFIGAITEAVVAPVAGVIFASAIAALYFELRRVKEGLGAQSIGAVFD